MGYTTNFRGHFTLDTPLTTEQGDYLRMFCDTRRMKRDKDVAATLKDPLRVAVGLPLGPDACYYVGLGEDHGQISDASILEYNDPPAGQPGLWCKWTVPDIGRKANQSIEWNGVEKFYDYIKWLEYIIKHFLEPWGRKVTGVVKWSGEEPGDVGKIIAKDNKLEIVEGTT